jgi:hypothetical protein
MGGEGRGGNECIHVDVGLRPCGRAMSALGCFRTGSHVRLRGYTRIRADASVLPQVTS